MTTAQLEAIDVPVPPKLWWLLLLEGIAAVLVGILLVTDPGATLVTLMVFLGVYWMIGGVFELVRMFLDHSQWGWRLASGLLGILAGLLVVRNPMWAAVLVPATLVWVLIGAGIAIGIVTLIGAFRGGGWQAAFFGLVSLGLALFLIAADLTTTVTLVIFAAAIFAIVGGLAGILFAFYVRRAA